MLFYVLDKTINISCVWPRPQCYLPINTDLMIPIAPTGRPLLKPTPSLGAQVVAFITKHP